jgi:hypothetical protein
VLRDPDELLVTVKSKRAALDAKRVDASTEVAECRRRLERVRREHDRLLDLYQSGHVDKATYVSRAAPLRQAIETLTAQIAQAEVQLAQGTAEVDRHAAALAYCKLIRTGLDRLDDAGSRDSCGCWWTASFSIHAG